MTVIASFKISSQIKQLNQIAEQINLPITNIKKIGDLKGKINNENIYHKENSFFYKISNNISIDDAIKIIDFELTKLKNKKINENNLNFKKEFYFSMLEPFEINFKSISILNKWEITFGID